MRTSTRRLAIAASAVLTLAMAGGVALAQVPPPPPAPPAPSAPPAPPPPMPMDMMMAGGPHIMMMRGPHGDPAAHAQHLRDVLQLRPDQDAALKAYLDGGKPSEMKEMMKDDGPEGEGKPLTTPERLDRQAARMADMAAMFQKRAAVTKAFYAALSPSQQKAFDALGPEMGGPRMEVRRIEMRHEGPPAGGPRRVIIQRKAG